MDSTLYITSIQLNDIFDLIYCYMGKCYELRTVNCYLSCSADFPWIVVSYRQGQPQTSEQPLPWHLGCLLLVNNGVEESNIGFIEEIVMKVLNDETVLLLKKG